MCYYFSSGSSKLDEAAELYQKAGNAFKMAKNWTASGQAFCQAAEVHLKQNTKHEGANMYMEAANSFKKADPQEALNCLNKTCEIYIDMGRLAMAAKQYQAIAELYETDLVDTPNAITYYEKAADLFKTEENNSPATKCLLKVAHFSALAEKYQRAIEVFEQVSPTTLLNVKKKLRSLNRSLFFQVGTAALENSLLKYGARDHFFRAGICHLCIDHLNCQQALARYEGIMASFGDSREAGLLKVSFFLIM